MIWRALSSDDQEDIKETFCGWRQSVIEEMDWTYDKRKGRWSYAHIETEAHVRKVRAMLRAAKGFRLYEGLSGGKSRPIDTETAGRACNDTQKQWAFGWCYDGMNDHGFVLNGDDMRASHITGNRIYLRNHLSGIAFIECLNDLEVLDDKIERAHVRLTAATKQYWKATREMRKLGLEWAHLRAKRRGKMAARTKTNT